MSRAVVLVVDDEPAICRAVALTLARAGYEPLTACSGETALSLIRERHVDALLVDLRIPDLRGDVLFELAAAEAPHLRTRTLFVTGDIGERAMRLVEACKCPMLLKPFELSDLLDAVQAMVPEEGVLKAAN